MFIFISGFVFLSYGLIISCISIYVCAYVGLNPYITRHGPVIVGIEVALWVCTLYNYENSLREIFIHDRTTPNYLFINNFKMRDFMFR